MIERYQECRWSANGMDFPCLNCWGLVRLARHELLGLPLLPALGNVDPYNKRQMTDACHGLLAGCISLSAPVPGAIAAAWRGSLCIHVGMVAEADGRLFVLDIDEGRAPQLTPLPVWQRRYLRVEFYNDRND